MILLGGSRRSEGAFACTVSSMKATIALQYSNDLWNSRTAPVFETFKVYKGYSCMQYLLQRLQIRDKFNYKAMLNHS